jgi:WD40 repeat protein
MNPIVQKLFTTKKSSEFVFVPQTPQYLAILSLTTSARLLWYKVNGESYTKLTNPTNPPGQANDLAWSTDGVYLAVAHASSPYISIYKRDGDTLTKLSNPSSLPAGTGYSCSWSPNGTYLAVGHVTTPFITIYKRNGDTFTKLSNSDPVPGYTVDAMAFDPSGTYLAVGKPYINNGGFNMMYKRDGDNFNLLSTPNGFDIDVGDDLNGYCWSPDNKYILVGHFEYQSQIGGGTVFKRNGDIFNRRSESALLTDAGTYCCAWSPDNNYLALGSSSGLFIHKKIGESYSRLYKIAPTYVKGICFSPDGNYLATCKDSGAESINIRKREGDVFTKLESPMDITPAGDLRGVAYWPVGIPGSK